MRIGRLKINIDYNILVLCILLIFIMFIYASSPTDVAEPEIQEVFAYSNVINEEINVSNDSSQCSVIFGESGELVAYNAQLYNNMLVGSDEDPCKPITSDPSITFSFEYVDNGVMPYALYVPSTASTNSLTPLIISLHGLDQCGSSKWDLKRSALPSVLNEWTLDGFNAYVLFPHLTKNASYERWNSASARAALNKMLNEFIAERNVDTSRISIVGYSLGGYGALYMASKDPDCYAACVSMSGYNAGIDLSKIEIPTIGYVGTSSAGEDPRSYDYMSTKFRKAFGDDKLTVFNTSHGGVPRCAFTEDKNGDNKSDLIEWILSQKR